MVLTWSKRKKYNENSYKETKLEIKLRHVLSVSRYVVTQDVFVFSLFKWRGKDSFE